MAAVKSAGWVNSSDETSVGTYVAAGAATVIVAGGGIGAVLHFKNPAPDVPRPETNHEKVQQSNEVEKEGSGNLTPWRFIKLFHAVLEGHM